jgi:hypothetical protein
LKFKFGKYPYRLTTSIESDHLYRRYGINGCTGNYTVTRLDRLFQKIDDVVQCIYNMFNKIYFDHIDQKISVKTDVWDIWSADTMLAHIILPTLIELKKCKECSPFVDDDDVPDNIKSTSDKTQHKHHDTDKFYHDRWVYVLDEMIFAFNTKAGDNQDWEDNFHSGEYDMQVKKLENGTIQMLTGPNDTHKYDVEGAKVYNNRINNGFRLFGVYYNSLWT